MPKFNKADSFPVDLTHFLSIIMYGALYESLALPTCHIHRFKFWFNISHIKCKLLPHLILKFWDDLSTYFFNLSENRLSLDSYCQNTCHCSCVWISPLMKFSWGYHHLKTRPCWWSDIPLWSLSAQPQPKADKGYWWQSLKLVSNTYNNYIKVKTHRLGNSIPGNLS